MAEDQVCSMDSEQTKKAQKALSGLKVPILPAIPFLHGPMYYLELSVFVIESLYS